MLILIENTPRAYAWGSTEALAEMLGRAPSGAPEAELWLGDHPGSPANVAKAAGAGRTLIDLIASDPDHYGVGGGPLPFLLKILAIGAPLSLQVHPDLDQARTGYAREASLGVAIDDPTRGYSDSNHKPELLVALTDVWALSGFRALDEAREDVLGLAAAAERTARGDAQIHEGVAQLRELAGRLAPGRGGGAAEAIRRDLLQQLLAHGDRVGPALAALSAGVDAALAAEPDAATSDRLSSDRLSCVRNLLDAYPADAGVLVALLLHLVKLAPGQAIFLRAGQLHAYLSGVAVEVMAASDNVLRAGLTPKHIDIAEVCRIVDYDALDDPRITGRPLSPGLTVWRPGIPDFQLYRAQLCGGEDTWNAPDREQIGDRAAAVEIDAPYPLVLVVTSGRIRIDRPDGELDEVASVRRGQSLYISAGAPIRLTGSGEAFVATVGEAFDPA